MATVSLTRSPLSTKNFRARAFDIVRASREHAVGLDAADRVPPAAVPDSDIAGSPAEESDRNTRIAARAYARYLSRGGENGDATTDWLEAEREIEAEAAR